MPSLTERIGSLTLPPDIGTIAAAKALTSLDPARRVLADLFKTAILAELTEAWVAAVANRLTDSHGISPTLPVADVLELEPTPPIMQARKAEFPLLCVYRSGQAEEEPHTFYAERTKQPWTVEWILGAGDVATIFQLGDLAVAASKIIGRVCYRGGHPAYQSGALQFGEDSPSGLISIRKRNHEGPGQASFAGDAKGTLYYAITINLESIEHTTEIAGSEQDGIFEGADYEIGVGGAPEGVMPGLVYASTDPVHQPQ